LPPRKLIRNENEVQTSRWIRLSGAMLGADVMIFLSAMADTPASAGRRPDSALRGLASSGGVTSATVQHESRERPDMLDAKSPAGLRVVQITTDARQPSWHVYTEAAVFTPDSRRFVFVRQTQPGPVSYGGRGRQYWLCDIPDNFGLRPLTDEPGMIRGTAMSTDGKWFYYIVEDPEITGVALVLRRVSLDTFRPETVFVIRDQIPGTNYRPSQVYLLSTISSDGGRLATGCFLGDGRTEKSPWGLLVFTLEPPSVRVVPLGADFNNLHPQYCRSADPQFAHDVLVQHNHGAVVDASGRTIKPLGGSGADLHVVRDDGTNWRDIPIGRDGVESVQGHQAWRGRLPSVLSAMNLPQGRKGIREGFPISTTDQISHTGSRIPGGRSWDLQTEGGNPAFWHFGVDDSGFHLVTDTKDFDPGTKKRRSYLFVGRLTSVANPGLKLRYLLETRASGVDQPMHPHPFFSPDASMAFFNTDVDGPPQVWMVTGFQFPE
jgi:hypothetical protein